eukprot:1659523-Amphidinium_carterae.1
MIALWRTKNDKRREKARMIAELKGVSLEFGDFGDVPMYRQVPVTHRVRRFQLGKLAIIQKELKEAEEATTRADEAANADLSAEPLSPKSIPTVTPTEPTEENAELGSSTEGVDLPALEVHEAQ